MRRPPSRSLADCRSLALGGAALRAPAEPHACFPAMAPFLVDGALLTSSLVANNLTADNHHVYIGECRISPRRQRGGLLAAALEHLLAIAGGPTSMLGSHAERVVLRPHLQGFRADAGQGEWDDVTDPRSGRRPPASPAARGWSRALRWPAGSGPGTADRTPRSWLGDPTPFRAWSAVSGARTLPSMAANSAFGNSGFRSLFSCISWLAGSRRAHRSASAARRARKAVGSGRGGVGFAARAALRLVAQRSRRIPCL